MKMAMAGKVAGLKRTKESGGYQLTFPLHFPHISACFFLPAKLFRKKSLRLEKGGHRKISKADIDIEAAFKMAREKSGTCQLTTMLDLHRRRRENEVTYQIHGKEKRR